MARHTRTAPAPAKYMINATAIDSWEMVSSCPEDIAMAKAMRFDTAEEGERWVCLWSHFEDDDALGIFEVIREDKTRHSR